MSTQRAAQDSPEREMVQLCRRLLRTGQRHHVINVAFPPVEQLFGPRGQIELFQNYLKDLVRHNRGLISFMSNGDAFAVFRVAHAARLEPLLRDIRHQLAVEDDRSGQKIAPQIDVFDIPDQYADLRRRTQAYEEDRGGMARADAPPRAESQADAAAEPAKPEGGSALQGPLTPALVHHIEHVLETVPIGRYLKQQPVYGRPGGAGGGDWQRRFVEHYTSVVDLRGDHFPGVEIHRNDPLFLQICRTLDAKVLKAFLGAKENIERGRISINLSLDSLFEPVFSLFTNALSVEQRGRVIIEINRQDLFRDIRRAGEALARLRREGYGIALDGMTFDHLAYVRVNKFDVDYFKIHALKDDIDHLRDPDTVKALRSLAGREVVLSRCDHEGALKIGEAFGIGLYQGWLIDEYAAGAG